MNPDGQGETPRALPRSQVSVKTVLTVAGTVLGLALAVYLLSRTLIGVGLVIACALIAVALDHAVQALVSRGWKRGLAIAAVAFLLFGLGVGIAWLVVPEAVRQVEQLVERLPALLADLRQTELYRSLDGRFGIESFLGGTTELPAGAVATSLQALRSVALWVILLITGLFVVFFMLIFGGELIDALLAEAVPDHRERYERLLRHVYRAVGGYIGGLAILSAVNATVNTAALAIFGLPFFLPLGLISGVASFLPYVGAVLAGTLMGMIGLATGGVWLGVAVVAWYITYQQLENHLLAPLIYERTVHLNPLVALLAVILLAEIAGIAGAILAVPLAAVGQTILKEILRFRRERLEVPPGVPVAEALEARRGDEEREPPPGGGDPLDRRP